MMNNQNKQNISPEQLRAARGMLGWTRSDLAKRTGLSAETIKNTECGTYSPKDETIKAITEAFAQQNLSFVCYEATASLSTDRDTPAYIVKASYTGVVFMSASVDKTQETEVKTCR